MYFRIFRDGRLPILLQPSRHERTTHGVAIFGNNLYVTDTGVYSIFHFKIETDFPIVAVRGTKGRKVGEFNYPSNLAVPNN